MRVLFVGNPSDKLTDGGGASFQRAIVPHLAKLPDCTYLQPMNPHRGEVAHTALKQRADLVWFLSPYFEMPPPSTPFVTTVWDLGHRDLPEFPEVSSAPGQTWTFDQREAYYQHVLPRAARVIVGTQTGADQVRRYYPVQPERIRIIPLCVDVESLQVINPVSVDPLSGLGLRSQQYLLYPAQFWPHKNHVTLVDMLSVLHDRGNDFKLVFTGADKGNQEYVFRYAQERGLTKALVFAGFVTSHMLNHLYRNAFALVFASLMGPDNLPPLEAMALECPVICSDYPGAQDQLSTTALYFDSLNPIEAADRVLSLIEEPDSCDRLRKTLIARGRHHVSTFCTADAYVNKVCEVIAGFEKTRRLWRQGYRHL